MSQRPYAFIARVLFVCVVTSSLAKPAIAQPAANVQFHFEIAAGTLDAVLAALERVAGVEVTPPENTTLEGLSSPGLSDTCTVAEALRQLLLGTGLTFRLSGPSTYSLQILPLSENVEVHGRFPYHAEVSTAATRTLTPLREVPQAVTVITQPMMAEQMMVGMADVVRYVPGVGMGQGEGNRDAPVLRGNSTTGDFFVDGVRDDVQYYRDVYNVERVEVLKGPNAMIFGRGGAGGVINRATRQADWATASEFTFQGGLHDNRRATVDLDRPINRSVAARLTSMYEKSDSFRRGVNLERYGLNPTLALTLNDSTIVRVGYERFHDARTADRGIPSFAGRPFVTDPSTFFGDPDLSTARVTVDAFTAGVDSQLGGVVLRNRTRYADYDKFYQNVYPSGPVTPDETMVSLGAYNNATSRRNLFNQTDLTFAATSGRFKHTVLAGPELGRQVTGNFRNTGYFTLLGPTITSMPVSATSPTVSIPVTFRQSATDADNHGEATVLAVYTQDQVQLAPKARVVAGIRFDRFDVRFRNNRNGALLSSVEHLVSPRLGFIYSPSGALSLYTSYSLAHVPRAGDQLSSLSLTNEALDPEKFVNYEAGAKWDAASGLSVTAAVYRLDRTNVAVPDPLDSTRSVLVDGQRMNGVEFGIAGNLTRAWRVLGAYAFQDGKITRTLAANARTGASLALVPVHRLSVWNRYDFSRRWGAGIGIVREGPRFTSTDNTVILPAFTQVDGALFATINRRLRAQMNVENVFNEAYYASSNGNNNIAPGAPRSLRASVTARF
ncbi:MAG: TonB-dependent siderophore receptor [Acidobacteriota bacterium]